ncbi:hypothetical protein IFM89_008869 [Coptis chinensis]|uniref:MI domain-containing protein n=1 Tax=Coptis chinensis TaxID=261450 RepID=A0A835HDW2_9MAGN|nr:hypothetical protein IFM89_008869 [Coptis chinensis]
MPGIDNNDNWEVQRSRLMPRGDLSAMQSVVRVQAPFTNKLTVINSKLLTQATTIDLVAYSPPTKPVTSVALVLPVEKRPAPVAKINPDELRKKTVSFLKEYFGIRILYEALQCVEELKARTECYRIPPGCYKLKEAFLVGLDMSPHMVEPIMKLLEYLFTRMVLTGSDIGTGCLLYGFQLNEIGIDLPKAPNNFGEIMGKLVLSGCLNFKVVKEILKMVEDDFIQKDIFDGTIECISVDPSSQVVLEA